MVLATPCLSQMFDLDSGRPLGSDTSGSPQALATRELPAACIWTRTEPLHSTSDSCRRAAQDLQRFREGVGADEAAWREYCAVQLLGSFLCMGHLVSCACDLRCRH